MLIALLLMNTSINTLMKRHLLNRLFLLLLITFSAPAAAQNDVLDSLLTYTSRHAFLRQLGQDHQEFRAQESDVLLQFGYNSTEHQALRRKIINRDSVLLLNVKRYLDRFGFPVFTAAEKRETERRTKEFRSRLDSLASVGISIDSIQRIARKIASRSPMVRFANPKDVVMLILGVDGNFTSRCSYIPFLLPVYEAGELPLVSMLFYLRHTYRIRHGEELSIPSGTTERERLEMYLLELSGCQ